MLTLELHRAGLGPQLAAGRDELLGAFVTGAVVADLTDPFKVVLDTSWHYVYVDTAIGYLVQSGGHLGEQSQGDEARPHGDEKADAFRHGRQGGGRGPGLGQRSVFGEEAVGEPSGDQQ